jgi:hypothetical protein
VGSVISLKPILVFVDFPGAEEPEKATVLVKLALNSCTRITKNLLGFSIFCFEIFFTNIW